MCVAQGVYDMAEVPEELKASVIEGIAAERRLRGLSAAERLRGLTPEQILECVHPEELLRGLTREERAQLRDLLEQETPN